MILPHFEDLTYQEGKAYNPWIAYSVSKSAGMLYSRTLAHKLRSKNISVFSLNPGSIASNLQQHVTPELIQDAIRLGKESSPDWKFPERKSLQQGCATQLRAALDPSLVAHTGSFLDDCQPTEPQEHVDAYSAAEKVWQISEEMVGERFDDL
jgi:NAD(P)-dependent dehydrogenase (short-subunit alcohol dehydrogenase family)